MATVIVPDGPGYGLGIRYFGDVDPGAVGAFAGWFDTATGALKFRNAADTLWVAVAGGTPALSAVLAVGADAGGVEITGLGAATNPDDATRMGDVAFEVNQLPSLLIVRAAAGVPSGAPTGYELPIAFDTTGSPATAYFWTGAAWAEVGPLD